MYGYAAATDGIFQSSNARQPERSTARVSLSLTRAARARRHHLTDRTARATPRPLPPTFLRAALMGCALLYKGEYENFIMEATIVNHDNDGIGFVFGWQSISDHYQAVAINDHWPSPAADGVDGPFMKLKRRDPALTRARAPWTRARRGFETL